MHSERLGDVCARASVCVVWQGELLMLPVHIVSAGGTEQSG